jgi:hypothetical protein
MKPWAIALEGEKEKETTESIVRITEIIIDETNDLIKMRPPTEVVAQNKIALLLGVNFEKVEVNDYVVSQDHNQVCLI